LTASTSFPATQPVTSISATSPPSIPHKRSNRKEVAIGAGVGVPLGVLAITTIALVWWRRKQDQSLRRGQELARSSELATAVVGNPDKFGREEDADAEFRPVEQHGAVIVEAPPMEPSELP
jgi:hypothetical protein